MGGNTLICPRSTNFSSPPLRVVLAAEVLDRLAEPGQVVELAGLHGLPDLQVNPSGLVPDPFVAGAGPFGCPRVSSVMVHHPIPRWGGLDKLDRRRGDHPAPWSGRWASGRPQHCACRPGRRPRAGQLHDRDRRGRPRDPLAGELRDQVLQARVVADEDDGRSMRPRRGCRSRYATLAAVRECLRRHSQIPTACPTKTVTTLRRSRSV